MSEYTGTEVAIVGMAGRFPGATDVDQLWDRIAAGADCLADLDIATLRERGASEVQLADHRYVRRSGVLDDVQRFDAAFFGIGARDAAIMDPQHRHFYECAWSAIESAGYVPEKFAGSIGVFAGCGMNTYLVNNLLTNPQLIDQLGWFLLRHTANDKDFLSTGVSYRLDLRGPSVNVQTACSTSLVAVHLGVQSLLSLECDMALAGGVTIEVPHGVGYQYHEGEILAPDGVCRAFDARSQGTVLTSGVGVVALRRLDDALREREPILAVIRGSAVNNDGQRKVSYLAPSVDGHTAVVREALAVAGLDAGQITMIEAHGTGTAVGDPIEFAALTNAFRHDTDARQFCWLGSAKPNIGHLDTAAGVASLIKVVQALQHRYQPPLANHVAASELLDVESSPFVLSGEGRPWSSEAPRRAGISSLGVGGTNAHVIVEEAPEPAASTASPAWQPLVLSAQTDTALDTLAGALSDCVSRNPDIELADLAHTLLAGRRRFGRSRVIVARDMDDAAQQLRQPARNRVAAVRAGDDPAVVFVFPGGGAQYAGMGALDERFSTFQSVRNEGIRYVREHGRIDLGPLLERGALDDALRDPVVSLSSIFITEVALARQWMAWGIEPAAMVGHSLGEYAAAVIAGVLSYADAVRLVVARAALMGRVSGTNAAMMVVPLPETEVMPLLSATVSLAAVNTADECVLSAGHPELDAIAAELAARDVTCTKIALNAAAHSHLLDPVLAEFEAVVRSVRLEAPQRRYVSNETGRWVTPEQVTDPSYWVRHLRHTVRFAAGVDTALSALGDTVVAELGPGHTLSSYIRRHERRPVLAVGALRHPNDDIDDTAYAVSALARVHAAGVDFESTALLGAGLRRRLRLPTYPFEGQRHWIAPGRPLAAVPATATEHAASTSPIAQLERIPQVDEWASVPVWIDDRTPAGAPVHAGAWSIVGDDEPFVAALASALRERGRTVAIVGAADEIDSRNVMVVGPAPDPSLNPVDALDRARQRWISELIPITQRLGDDRADRRLVLVTRGATEAGSASAANPSDALALGVGLVAPVEFANINTLVVDADCDAEISATATIAILCESDRCGVVAVRSGATLGLTRKRVPLEPLVEADKSAAGTYVVTGALGGVGFELARSLARPGARLAVIASEPVVSEELQADYLATHASGHRDVQRLRRLRQLRSSGAQVDVVVADTADPRALRDALAAIAKGGPIAAIVHAAGRLRDRPLALIDAEGADVETVVGPKARGAAEIVEFASSQRIPLVVLLGSTSTILAPGGQSVYVAANAYCDALSGYHESTRVLTIDFGGWAGTGMAHDARRRLRLGWGDEPVDHPVFTHRRTRRDGAVEMFGLLSTADWVVAEHRVRGGDPLLPGTGHLELLSAAARIADGAARGLARLSILAPLAVPEGFEVAVRAVIDAPAGQPRLARLEYDGGSGGDWLPVSEAELAPLPQEAETITGCGEGDAVDSFTDRLRRHIAIGPRWDQRGTLAIDRSTRVARLALTIDPTELEAWWAHPAVLDVATAIAVDSLPDDPEKLYVPVRYRAARVRRPLRPDIIVRTRALSPTEATIEIFDTDGTLCALIEGVSFEVLSVAAIGANPVAPSERDAAPATELLDATAQLGITPTEGVEAFGRAVAGPHHRVIISSLDLDALIDAARPSPLERNEAPAAGSAAASGDSLSRVRALWCELLGVASVEPDDDFFELGGHSLIAIRLMARIHKELGVRLPLATLFDAPTPRLLAQLLPDRGTVAEAAAPPAPTEPSLIVTMRAGGARSPLFLIHGAGGNVLNMTSFARLLRSDRPVMGVLARGNDGSTEPDGTIEAMADRYMAQLIASYPQGPYLLGGYSGGGMVALEMAQRLHDRGTPASLVVLFDTLDRLVPSAWSRWSHLIGHTARRGPQVLGAWTAETVRRQKKKVGLLKDDVETTAARALYDDFEGVGFVNLSDHFEAVANRYRRRRIDADVVLVKAAAEWVVRDESYGWRQHIAGRFETVVSPGTHQSMFLPGNVEVLAELLGPIVDAAEARALG